MTASKYVRPALLAVLATLVLPVAAAADDRDVLRDSSARPYVFIILDTSGSMNWAPRCTAQQVTDGVCTYLCPTGDCSTPRNGDDPASKFRQAKEAIYEVIRGVDDVDFGFGTYNQDDLSVANKHFYYRVRAGQPQVALAGGFNWPEAGSEEVFGANWTCDTGGTADDEIACYANNNRAADTNEVWELTRARRFSKLGALGATANLVYIRNGGRVYRITYDDPGTAQTLGSPSITARIMVDLCTGTPNNNPSNGCDSGSEVTTLGTIDVAYDMIGDFVQWDYRVGRTPALGNGDGYWNLEDSSTSNTCSGWDPNSDSVNDDNGSSYNLKQPTVDDPANPDRHATIFDYGDVIPMDWTQDNRLAILNRLAPRLNGGDPASDLEAFGNATYLNEQRIGAQTYLRYKDTNQRALFPSGSTPVGASLTAFRTWYKGCASGTCSPSQTGWDDLTAVGDPKWACRQKFIIFLTDGDETCGSNPCGGIATRLFNDGVRTYMVAFGVDGSAGNSLNCIAQQGGTTAPIYPQNKQELVRALTDILGAIRETSASFASAAVPQVQANVSDKIFLSSFTPLNDAGYWAGRLDAFLKPLPLDDNNQPDRSVPCDSSTQAKCFLWDAGDVQAGLRGGSGIYDPERMLLQAPHPADVQPVAPWDPGDLQLGVGADQRRVYYAQANEAGNRRLFTYPTNDSEKYDLWTGMEIPFVVGDPVSEAAALAAGNETIVTTLLEKEDVRDVPDPDDPGSFIQEPITYLMGDIFHADPVVFGRPTNFNYYSTDPFLNKPLCGAAADPGRTPPTSYRWFADRNFCRRSLLLAAANDGQLHAFDSGIFRDAGGIDFECLLPAKDLDADGTAEVNEFTDSLVDYDLNDNQVGNKSCDSDGDCSSGPCQGGFCRDVKVGVVDGAYDNGRGFEVFSFIPRAMLPTVHGAAHGDDRNRDFWGMDAGVRIDDVFIDPLASEVGSVTCLDREWRTVAIGGYREGGPGYYALDLTQPDLLDSKNVPQPVSGYVPSCLDGGASCGNRPYPAVLWEFDDHALVQTSGGIFINAALDEDLNDFADLANSWSKASTGRIRVCTGACDAASAEDRFVAVFGGGVGDSPTTATGNYIYMVDIETGQTLYKKQVIGAAPADVAAIDSNGDTYIDRLYIGTTSGFVYKVQLETSPATPMQITSQTVQTRIAGVDYNHPVQRLSGPAGDLNKYDPYQLFSTGGRPIYLEISAIFVAAQNRVAMAFGTGNRWNLWDASGQIGRFYVLLDDNFVDSDRDGVLDVSCGGCTEPLTESKYTAIDPDAPFDPSNPIYYLYNGGGGNTLPGYYFTLGADEKVITEAFSLAGVTIFTVFHPTESSNSDGTCSRAGESKIFTVGTVTALGYSIPEGGDISDRARYTEIPQFTTPPFVEQSATANPEDGSGTQHADYVTDSLAIVRDELKTLQSERCRYANYTQNIKTIRSDTGMVFIAPIPLCIDPNLKGF